MSRKLTEEEQAKRLSVSPKTLQNWRWSGKGPPFIKLVSGGVRYDEDVTEEWIRRRTFNSTTAAAAAGRNLIAAGDETSDKPARFSADPAISEHEPARMSRRSRVRML